MATVLITGANQGIGLALARTYAVRDDTIFATARDPAKADALRLLAPNVLCMPLDITSNESLAALAARLQNRPIEPLRDEDGVGRGDEQGAAVGGASPGGSGTRMHGNLRSGWCAPDAWPCHDGRVNGPWRTGAAASAQWP